MTVNEYLESKIEDILDYRKHGKTYKEIASILNTPASSLGRFLRNKGIYSRTKMSVELIENIVDKYNSGHSILSISQSYHLSECTVSEILKNNGVHIKTMSECKQLYTLDETYFDEIDTPSKAYVLGWLWSDGHNCTSRNSIVICLQEQDKYILDFINKELKSNRPIKFIERSKDTDYNRMDQYRLTITNKHMSKTLLEYGMTHDKGLTAEYPSCIPTELHSHFIRGYFEGDGYVSKNPSDCRLNFTGTKNLCEGIQSVLTNTLKVHTHISILHGKVDKPTRTLWVPGRLQARKVLEFMYKDASHVLIRKYSIYQQIYAA